MGAAPPIRARSPPKPAFTSADHQLPATRVGSCSFPCSCSHCEGLPPGPMSKSELLFPSDIGRFRAGSCLNRPIRLIAQAAGISKRLTAKFMRRTFQDLARAANVHDFVTRTISGHATVEMQRHYSTVGGDEVRSGLERVLLLAGFRAAVEPPRSGDAGGDSESRLISP